MSLPVPPDAETILKNGLVTIRDVLLPAVGDDEWAKFNAGLLAGALEYAVATLKEDRGEKHRAALAEVLEGLRPLLKTVKQTDLIAPVDNQSAFEAASTLLIWCQNNPGETAAAIQSALHAELHAQLDEELEAASPIMDAFGRGMRGEL